MKMNRPNMRLVALLSMTSSAGFGLFGCALESASDVYPFEDAELVESTESALLPAGCTALGPTVNAHACSHGPSGPYDTDTASSNPNFAGSNPKLEVLHTYYTVTLPFVSPGVYRGTVKFTPVNDDDHIVYVDGTVAVTVKDKNNNVVSSQLSSSFSDCTAYLDNYSVYEMKKSTSTHAPYKLTFEAASSPVKVLLEEVKPLRARWYPDADGDTYGPPTPSVLTACLPSAGYVTTTAGDCNDSNPAVYPGSGCP
jgi:hypothetical protein